jgi:transketolase
VEVSTGPLGQGISNAVGFAIAERNFAATYNTEDTPNLFDHFIYVICGDGCLQEGISSEASSLAGHLGLGKLIVLYDDNQITIDGPTELSFTEDVTKRYEAYGWHVQIVNDIENGIQDLRAAVRAAQQVTDKPSLIKVRTTIGYGSLIEGSAATHGAPLKPDDLEHAKQSYGLDPKKSFYITEDVYQAYGHRVQDLEKRRTAWDQMYARYAQLHPDKAQELERRFNHQVPLDAFKTLPAFTFGKDTAKATRQYSQEYLNALAKGMPELMGGSADLTPSNLTALASSGDFQKNTPGGRYIRFGVREHGMAAICNGLFAYGGIRPFCATFLNFAGYALGSIRLSALSKFGVIYIMTHDSIGLGEDGPTHQPVEMLESLRSMPNIHVFRPADANETNAAYQSALTEVHTPTVICCSRATLPALEPSSVEKALKGAYVVVGQENDGSSLILVASGSEVGPCITAASKLSAEGIQTRVVSIPCQELFFKQSTEYQKSILPGNIPTLSVEASAVHGWHRLSHAQIGMTRFGMSAPAGVLFERFGFSANNIVEKGKALVDFYKKEGQVPNLMSRPTFDNGVTH